MNASALVAATATKGARSVNVAARSPPIAGPATLPAELAAEMMLFANESRARSATCEMYSRAETRLAPAPNPAIALKAISAAAVGAAAMSAFAALYVAIPAAMNRRGPKRSLRNPVPNCETALATAAPSSWGQLQWRSRRTMPRAMRK